MSLATPASFVQTEPLPPGSYTITPAMQTTIAAHTFGADVYAAAEGGPAHPIFAHLATHVGKSWTFNDFLRHVHAEPKDGVVFGGGTFEFARPLLVGTTYRIDAWVSDAVRKTGRRLGVFDAITMTHEATAEGDAEATVRTTETYIVPRGRHHTGGGVGGDGGESDSPPSPADVSHGADDLLHSVGPVRIDSIRAIMELMSDTNPVHLDRELALRTGYRGRVNQGPANLAYLLAAVARWRGAADDLRRASFRFHATVTEEDVLDVVAAPSVRTAPRARVELRVHDVGTALVADLEFAPQDDAHSIQGEQSP